MTHVDASVDKQVLSRCTKFLKDAVSTNLQQPIDYLHSFGEPNVQELNQNNLSLESWKLKCSYTLESKFSLNLCVKLATKILHIHWKEMLWPLWSQVSDFLRACSHGSGGPQAGEVSRPGGVTNLSIQSFFFS